MKTILTEKLRKYIAAYNPELILSLPDSLSATRFIEGRVDVVMPLAEQLEAGGTPLYIIEEQCMEELTAPLRPSKFSYIREILEEDFLQTCNRYLEMGVLTYEIINLIEACTPVFEKIGFTEENEDDRKLRYAITGAIAEYLERK